MTVRPARGPSAHPRLCWALFWAASAVALVACAVAAETSGHGSEAPLAVLGGLIVVGIAAALLVSILAPYPDGVDTYGSRGTGAGGFGGGGFDGGGFGGGDCGGGGGGAC